MCMYDAYNNVKQLETFIWPAYISIWLVTYHDPKLHSTCATHVWNEKKTGNSFEGQTLFFSFTYSCPFFLSAF